LLCTDSEEPVNLVRPQTNAMDKNKKAMHREQETGDWDDKQASRGLVGQMARGFEWVGWVNGG